MKNNIKWFDDPMLYAQYLDGIPAIYHQCYDHHPSDWIGGGFDYAVGKLKNGDTTNLAKAQAIVDKMADEQIFTHKQKELENSVVGYAPNVPNSLMGHPLDMYNIVETENISLVTPIRIFVETGVSSALSNSQLTNRGVAALALAISLNIVKPVELYAASYRPLDNGHINGAIVKISTNPIDLEHATYMLTNNGYSRRLCFAVSNYQSDIRQNMSLPVLQERRDLCMCNSDDIIIKGGVITDALMLTNPVQWVKDMIAKHRGDVNES